MAFSSVHPIISVSLLVRARDEPVECLPWTRRTGVCLYLPCPEMYVPRAGVGGLCQSYLPRLAEVLNSKLAHAFTWPQRSKQPAIVARSGPSSFRLTGVCRDLSPLPPLPSSLPLFCPLGVFLNVILRFTPLSHWCVPGRFSWEHLSSSFSFPSLSLFSFLSFPSFLFGCPWMLSS